MFVNIFFSERIAAMWNNLECSIVDFTNTKRFKMSLLFYDLSRYTRF